MTFKANLTVDEFKAMSGSEPAGSNARSRSEVRANARKQSTAERAREIQDKLRAKSTEDPGEVTQSSEPEPTPERQSRTVEEAPAAENAPTETSEETTPKPTERARQSDAQPSMASMSDVANALGVDAADLRNVTTTVTVDGEEVQVNLGEALDSYRFQSSTTKVRQELRDRQRAIEAERNEALRTLHAQHEQAQLQLQAAKQVLLADFNNPDVQAMRQDPEQAALFLQVQEATARQLGQLETLSTQLAANARQQRDAETQRRRVETATFLRSEISDYDSDERKAAMVNVLRDAGLDDNEIRNVDDRRVLLFVSKYADLQKRVKELEAEKASNARDAKKVAKQAKGAKVNSPEAGSRRMSKAKSDNIAAIKNARGHARRHAAAKAIADVLRQRRQ